MKHAIRLLGLGVLAVTVAGCHTDMYRQAKVVPQEKSDFFGDALADRPPVPGTVARGKLRNDDAKYTGYLNGRLVTEMPATLKILNEELSTRSPEDVAKILKRGKERYTIFCSHCHGAAGDGNGMIAQRGFNLRRPVTSYHSDRLRQIPIGHLYDVITRGYGTMFSQAPRVEPDDRWAIVAYVRALQLSQWIPADQLPADDQAKLGTALNSRSENSAQ